MIAETTWTSVVGKIIRSVHWELLDALPVCLCACDSVSTSVLHAPMRAGAAVQVSRWAAQCASARLRWALRSCRPGTCMMKLHKW